MIQRIQSIYLFLAAAFCIGAILTPLPYALNNGVELFMHYETKLLALPAITAAIALFSLINIFLFKNRKLQANICRFNMLLTLVLTGVAVYYVVANGVDNDLPSYSAGFPLLIFLANWLALRGIKFDDKLVSSADRLR